MGVVAHLWIREGQALFVLLDGQVLFFNHCAATAQSTAIIQLPESRSERPRWKEPQYAPDILCGLIGDAVEVGRQVKTRDTTDTTGHLFLNTSALQCSSLGAV